ncbi:TPA: hypothetical protein ACOFDK_001227 [Stenotrophomonas maltophilia]
MSKYARLNPLHESAANGDLAETTALLLTGVDPNSSGRMCLGNTPLHAVVNAFGHTDTPALFQAVNLLLNAGANPDAPNGSGISAIKYAAAYAPPLAELFSAFVRSRELNLGLPSVEDWRATRSSQSEPAAPARRPRF